MIKFTKNIKNTIGKGEHYLFNSDNMDFFNKNITEIENKIDVITIDPPYNTGKKMGKYKDSFGSIEKWLEFLKPRLIMAKRVLKEDGIIFININDLNQPYLRILCNDIFGIKNFISNIIWQNKYSVSNDKHGITTQTEHILVYAKNKKNIIINNDSLRKEYVEKTYKNWDNDERGKWRKGIQLWKNKNPKEYTVTSPTGKKWTKKWNYNETEWYNTLEKNNLLYWGKDGNSCPTKKVFLKDTKGRGIRNLWLGEEVGYTQNGTTDLKEAIGEGFDFLYPKPVKLIERILKISHKKDSYVLDFFAGSGTLGEAVYSFNKKNNTNIKFILVTNNENNICEDITLKRVSKFANKNNGGLTYIA